MQIRSTYRVTNSVGVLIQPCNLRFDGLLALRQALKLEQMFDTENGDTYLIDDIRL